MSHRALRLGHQILNCLLFLIDRPLLKQLVTQAAEFLDGPFFCLIGRPELPVDILCNVKDRFESLM
jgi:hypothetical protein